MVLKSVKNNEILKLLIVQILQYQRLNNITSQCVTNCKFLYDFFRVKFNIKLNVVVGFVVLEKDGGFTLCTHVWVEYDNVHYEPSFEWIGCLNRFTTIYGLLNSSIWDTVKIHVDCYDQRDSIRKLIIDLKIHNQQVNIFQNTDKKYWTPAISTVFCKYYEALKLHCDDCNFIMKK